MTRQSTSDREIEAADREARLVAGAAELAALLLPVQVVDDERLASRVHRLDDLRHVEALVAEARRLGLYIESPKTLAAMPPRPENADFFA